MRSNHLAAAAVAIFAFIPVGSIAEPTTDDEDESETAATWTWSVSGGLVHWPSLQDQGAAPQIDFDAIGWVLEVAFHRPFREFRGKPLLAGFDIGMFLTESEFEGELSDYSHTGMYLTPSLRWRLMAKENWYGDITLGAGYYEANIVQQSCWLGSCVLISEAHTSSTFGGYIGAAYGATDSFFVDAKIHFASFEDGGGQRSPASRLSGPILTAQLGWRFK